MNPSFDSLIETGLDASRRDDADAALQAWHSAAAASPASALPHFLMGAEFAQAGRIAEAEAAYANAVLLAPEFETARYQLGLLQFTSGRAAVAQVTWEPLFRLDDTQPLRHFVQGFAALARDAFDSAVAHFETGMALNHVNPPMNADIAQIVAAIRRSHGLPSNPHRAADALPKPEEAHVLLAAYQRQGSVH